MRRSTGLTGIIKIDCYCAILDIIIGILDKCTLFLVDTEDINSFCTRFGRCLMFASSGRFSGGYIEGVSYSSSLSSWWAGCVKHCGSVRVGSIFEAASDDWSNAELWNDFFACCTEVSGLNNRNYFFWFSLWSRFCNAELWHVYFLFLCRSARIKWHNWMF